MFGLPSIYVTLGVAALSAAGSSLATWRVVHNAWVASQVEEVKAGIAAYKADAARENAEAAATLATEEKIRVVTKTVIQRVDKIVDRPIYVRACFDDDGLRLVNASLTGAALDSSQPAAALQPPTPARER